MTFQDRLEKKMAVDKLALRVAASLKGPNSGIKFDQGAMRRLLEKGPFRHVRERDTDLYLFETSSAENLTLVLDNGLPIYNTNMEDVLLRKSPTVKEMVSFTNAFKILYDKDVLKSKKIDSLKIVRRVILEGLDLVYDEQDIRDLALSGRNSFETQSNGDVEAILGLFAELLNFSGTVPKAFITDSPSKNAMGRFVSKGAGEYEAGPVIIYDSAENKLAALHGPFNNLNIEQMEKYYQSASGRYSSDISGAAVFDWLCECVLDQMPEVSTHLDGVD